MAKKSKAEATNESEQPITAATGINTPPMANNEVDTSVDESPATVGMSDFDANTANREQHKRVAEQTHLEVDRDEEGGLTQVRAASAVGINPSSTYPGRDMELAENDMRLPSAIDLAKRAKFAGSQVPERVINAGLTDEEGNITVDVDEGTSSDNG